MSTQAASGSASPHHVVIVGGGFGGLTAAKTLRRAPVRVTLLDRRNFHLFQPLLYQVATGNLSNAHIAWPLRSILRRQTNVQVLLAEVRDIDAANRCVILDQGATLGYDTLVVAAGASHSYFGHDEWHELAPGLKSLEDATELRRRIFLAFEAAERTTDLAARKRWLTFVIVGGGPTGVEMAGALAEIAHHVLRHDFRTIDPSHATILLIEGADRLLPPFDPALAAKATAALIAMGVTVKTGALVTNITTGEVTYRIGQTTERVAAGTVFWAAGVQASPLSKALAKATGATLDRAGRVSVEPDLTIAGHPEIFAIGDMTHLMENGQPLPGVAQVALQQGRHVAKVIQARLHGEAPPKPFHYVDLGSMAVIGRAAAVVQARRIKLSGPVAWLAWAFIHVIKLMGVENRLKVLVTWAWHYTTWNSDGRLITGGPGHDPSHPTSGRSSP
ncbi:MAG: NAD(P)/FAD-dependent oxidoreductase [Candidatus Rokuibacteriota bacterium]